MNSFQEWFAEISRHNLEGFCDLSVEIRGQLCAAAGDFFCVLLAFVPVSVAKEGGAGGGGPFLRDGNFLSHVHQPGVFTAFGAS